MPISSSAGRSRELLRVVEVVELADLDVLREVDDRADRLRDRCRARARPRCSTRSRPSPRRRRPASPRARRGTSRTLVEQVSPVARSRRRVVASIAMCALLPRILRFRSAPKPPMIDDDGAERARADARRRRSTSMRDDRQKAALARAHVARGDERHEAAGPRGDRAASGMASAMKHDHEADAAQRRADAHDLVPEHEGAAARAPAAKCAQMPSATSRQHDEHASAPEQQLRRPRARRAAQQTTTHDQSTSSDAERRSAPMRPPQAERRPRRAPAGWARRRRS